MAGLFDYGVARQIAGSRPPFDALIMAAAMSADTANLARLQVAFPELVTEVRARQQAPGGELPVEAWRAAE